MPVQPSLGYLTEFEASHLIARALPGAVVLQLKRDLEPGLAPKRMFIELSLGEAVRHWQDIGELIREAGAMEAPTRHADAASNL